MKKISKTKAKERISEFFKDIKSKSPKAVNKIKKIAMSHNLPLKENRKLFCKRCFAIYKTPKTRIKNKTKVVTCENCGAISRWKLK